MSQDFATQLEQILEQVGVTGPKEVTRPPNAQMGDFAFACFVHAKKQGENPAECAQNLVEKIQRHQPDFIREVAATGPYLNFFLQGNAIANLALQEIGDDFASSEVGKGQKYMVEFACPNPMKAFHLGHLRNTITGESVARLLENAGYEVLRVNYQGDVGRHIAMSLYGIYQNIELFEQMEQEPVRKRVEFLGQCYAHGARAFEESEEKKQAVIAYNDKVYEHSLDIQEVYQKARQWSLEYFDTIYEKLDTRFDHMYFESQTYERGVEIVKAFMQKGVFRESEGAIIFEGSAYGLHDRVFINSKGFPTYEAKDLALSEMRFAQYNPDRVIHVVGKEQTEYFKVVFKALELIAPQTIGKEFHLVGGYLQLKGDQKMSSRTGNVVTGDQLIEQVESAVQRVMEDAQVEEKEKIARAISVAALKYSMLKVHVSSDIAFDIENSVTLSGDSGPYLLYIVARIKSILRKAHQEGRNGSYMMPAELVDEERQLLLKLLEFPQVTTLAAKELDPSKVAHYVFDLAQLFNVFYHQCPVIQDDKNLQAFRIKVIEKVLVVMEKGLGLLGISVVEKM
ncbi:arginine--tRNA ligase [Candidatus Nomurabacteria bacterium]|nr:arginine--tRNA ligase [Candidatus Nomurabacteria bacterium]